MKLPSRLALNSLPMDGQSLKLLEQLEASMVAEQVKRAKADEAFKEPIEFVLVEPKRAA